MASEILGNVTEKAKGLAGEKTGKMAQFAAVTKDVHDPKWRITSDFGVKQSNTDDWLSVATDDQQGPSLLEDQFAREKVSTLSFTTLGSNTNTLRFTASTTSAFQSVLFTPVAPVPLESLPSSSPPKT
jgi:hypothetical protein